MDKFTVDLDQVLNDFEYSELTDQYHTVRSPVDTSSSVNHSNVTKHSINNVFHSLNEYLNTNIDIPANTVSKVEDLDRGDVSCNKNTNDDNSLYENVETDCDLSDSKHFFDDYYINGYVNEVYPRIDYSEKLPNIQKFDVIQEEDENPEANCLETQNESSQEGDIDPNKKIIVSTITIYVEEDDERFVIKVGVKEPRRTPAAPCVSMLEENKETESSLDDDNDTEQNADKTLSDLEVEEESTEENLSQEIVKEEPIGKDDVNVQKNEVEDNILSKPIEAIGFKAVTDIHDDEIDELLAELENDKDLIEEQRKESLHQEETTLEQTKHTIGEVEMEQKAIAVLEDVRQDVNSTVQEVKEVIETETPTEELVPSELSTEPSSNANIKVELPIDEPVKEIIVEELPKEVKEMQYEENDIANEVLEEKLTEESSYVKNPINIEEPVEAVLVKEQKVAKADVIKEGLIEVEIIKPNIEEINTNEEESCSKEETEKETEDVGKDVKYERQDSASRPQHLPLKEEETDKQREINLIGDPGSTPYNNVYISEEINKQEERDNESISSASSNTFSDTGSTASTASTEEIRDDNDEIKPKLEQNQTTSPNNEERETRELTDDRISERTIEETSDPATEGEARATLETNVNSDTTEKQWLGKEAPLWIPDSDTTSCLHCDMKFTVLKRRHHCRACGLVLCSKCCHLRFKLEYLDAEARVCNKCHDILNKDTNSSSSSDLSPEHGNSPFRRPNPNNPLEYCSTISPLQQVSGAAAIPLPAVMVPVGVLKRTGSSKSKSNKSVMFCDGIRPGSDLTNLDNDFNYNNTKTKKLEKTSLKAGMINRNLPLMDSETNSFIPKSENSLPPLVTITKTDISYMDCLNNPTTVELLKNDQVTFAILLSLYVHVKIINMSCCVNKMAWCFSTEGLINVGQDEIVIILEYLDEESFVPKDVFYHINNIYVDAVKGISIKELGLSLHNSPNFLDSKNHAGFVYIRPTFQCIENVIKPKEPFLVGILIHRWETPWAKLFPLRLILRLGAEYRYYPCPIISTRHRDSVFVEIGHTIINLLADFRNFSYTLPQINGLTIHMEEKNTTVIIPLNRYDQVIKSLNNSSDHILAFAGTFNQEADSHLVCIQDTQGNDNCYSTHAINIQNRPRKVTGASFIVFNGALKSSSGLTAKSNIVEDGLMIQVLPEHMQQIRDNLRAMKNHTIQCGCVNADSDETINLVWGENDINFNIGVTSAIDGMPLNGVPSIRVHNGKNYSAKGNRIIRWTEVFIIQNVDDSSKNQEPVDISKLSENIAKATCDALINYLDLLVTNNFQKIGIRTNLQADNVSYCAGSNNTKLPPIYMKSLDNELVPVLHRISSSNLGDNGIILELVFRILNV